MFVRASVPFALTSSFGDETAFRRIQVPNAKGQAVKATLTFSDQNKTVQIQPAKGGGNLDSL